MSLLFQAFLLCCCKAFQKRFFYLPPFTGDAICSTIFLCYKSVVHNHFWKNAPYCHYNLLLPQKSPPQTQAQKFWPMYSIQKCQVPTFFFIKTTGNTQVLVDVSVMPSSTVSPVLLCCNNLVAEQCWSLAAKMSEKSSSNSIMAIFLLYLLDPTWLDAMQFTLFSTRGTRTVRGTKILSRGSKHATVCQAEYIYTGLLMHLLAREFLLLMSHEKLHF